MNNKIIALIIGGFILICTFSFVSMYFSYNRSEVALRSRAEAEIQKVEVIHDEMWKTIAQEAKVTTEYRNGFDSIYTHIIEGRYSGTGANDGALMKWIKESNPKFTPDLYKKLMISIESLREKFAQQQITVLDVIREHQKLCDDPWKHYFITNLTPIEYTVISSTKSKQVIETRTDDDIELF